MSITHCVSDVGVPEPAPLHRRFTIFHRLAGEAFFLPAAQMRDDIYCPRSPAQHTASVTITPYTTLGKIQHTINLINRISRIKIHFLQSISHDLAIFFRASPFTCGLRVIFAAYVWQAPNPLSLYSYCPGARHHYRMLLSTTKPLVAEASLPFVAIRLCGENERS